MDGHSLHSSAAEAQGVDSLPSVVGRTRASRRLLLASGIGLALAALGYLVDREAAAGGLLVAALYGVGIAVGGLAFVALGHVTGAGWSTALRRIPEGMAGTLPIAGAIVLVTLVLALPIYLWADGEAVARDDLLAHKQPWLNEVGFLFRAAMYVGVWVLFSWALRKTSRTQDETGGIAARNRSVVLSAGFLVVFAITFTLASFDWVMSLEPHWFSTVFAIYNFSGAIISALAVIVIVAIVLERTGPLRGVLRTEHLHDLGKLMLGFTTFWAYIWYCQYMLIWYSDIPEETAYFVRRTAAGWEPLMIGSLILTWLIPFLMLLPRPAKRSRANMLRVAMMLLLARWLDLHLLVMPAVTPDAPWAFAWQIPAVAGVLCLLVWAFLRVFRGADVVPTRDPLLEESLEYHA